ncbi:RHS repeat domain-containing protein, partial [Chryseobacterium balustinum]
YKYNGKELQETGMYDYQARQLMVDAPGFLQIDPLAEKMPWMSPYAYAFNNPIRNTDPTGMEPEDVVDDGGDDGSSEQCCGPFFGGLTRFMPLLEGGSNIKPNPVIEIATKTGETAAKTNEHHNIPRQFRKNEIIEAARKEGFKFEGKENKSTLEQFSKATGSGRHGNHPKYNQQIKELLREIPKSDALNGVRKLRDHVSDIIKSNPETKINDLKLKSTPPAKINNNPRPQTKPQPQPSMEQLEAVYNIHS